MDPIRGHERGETGKEETGTPHALSLGSPDASALSRTRGLLLGLSVPSTRFRFRLCELCPGRPTENDAQGTTSWVALGTLAPPPPLYSLVLAVLRQQRAASRILCGVRGCRCTAWCQEWNTIGFKTYHVRNQSSSPPCERKRQAPGGVSLSCTHSLLLTYSLS